jgi:hypothetical protein
MVFEILKVVCDYLKDVYDDVVLLEEDKSLQYAAVVVQNFITITFARNDARAAYLDSQILSGLNVCWNASPIADMVADSVAGLLMQFFSATQLVRMTINASRNSGTTSRKKSRVSKDTGLLNNKDIKRETDELMERMETGQIDPSRKIPTEFVREGTATKLSRLRDMISKSSFARYFSSISLNQDSTKLIFRGHQKTTYTIVKGGEGKLDSIVTTASNTSNVIAEGFCFISFGGEEGADIPLNMAVVQSDSEEFKNVILLALKHIES